jgi:hypothetical protein
MARDSPLYSSRTVRHLSVCPLARLSWTKSYAHISLTVVAADRKSTDRTGLLPGRLRGTSKSALRHKRKVFSLLRENPSAGRRKRIRRYPKRGFTAAWPQYTACPSPAYAKHRQGMNGRIPATRKTSFAICRNLQPWQQPLAGRTRLLLIINGVPKY